MGQAVSFSALLLAGMLLPLPRPAFARTAQRASAAGPAGPVRLAAADADSITRAIEKDRAETREWLKSAPTSYLATVDRRDFGERSTLTVGSGEGSDVRLEDPGVARAHLRVTVVGDSFHVESGDGRATFRVGDAERTEATLAPSSIGVGRFTLRLSHQRFPAIIVFDPQSPRFQDYKGLEYFPVNLAYRYMLKLTPDPSPDTVVILSTRGNQRRALRAGRFEFLVGNGVCRLEATRLLEPGVGERDLGVFFRDATSGKESYGLGRYVDVEPLEDGRYVLDFNRAYNPACAFSEHYNCPIPPRANMLKLPIRAGEKDSHYMAEKASSGE
ncbi:MAG TPA: DUF1684 domain-containing protein [Candidatus Eisenbacteria bacterium]